MTKQVQLRRGTAAEHAVFTGAIGELTIDTTNDVAIVHDGVTQGGIPLVGTLAEQKILNKTAIGIGTGSLNEGLYVKGKTDIRGDLFMLPDPTLTYTGIISYFDNQNTITGIATAGVDIGNRFALGPQIHVGSGATIGAGATTSTVTGVGQSTITLSDTFDTGYFASQSGQLDGFSDGVDPTSGPQDIIGINTDGIVASMRITGPGIPDDTRVFSIGSGTITIDKQALNTTTGVAIQPGSTTAGSNVVSIDDTNEGISTGMVVTDDINGTSNIPANTTITAILGGGSIRISNNAILTRTTDIKMTNTQTFKFGEFSTISFTAYFDSAGIGSIGAGNLQLTKFAKIGEDLEVSGIATIGAGLSVLSGRIFSVGAIEGQSTGQVAGQWTANRLISENDITGVGLTMQNYVVSDRCYFNVSDNGVVRMNSGIATSFNTQSLTVTTGIVTSLTAVNLAVEQTGTFGDNVILNNGNLNVNSGFIFGAGDLDIGGQTELSGDLNVTGFSTVSGGATFAQGIWVSAAATVIDNVEIRDGNLTVSHIAFGTATSYKGHGLSIEPNVNIGGEVGPGILTAKYIVANNTGDIAKSGNTIDYLPFQISGIDTSRIFRGDRVSVAGTVSLYTIKTNAIVSDIGIGTVFVNQPIERTGSITTSFGYLDGGAGISTISGINTTGAVVGYGITFGATSQGTTIAAIGVSAITLSAPATNTRDELFTLTGGSIGIGLTVISGVNTTGVEVGDTVENPTAFTGTPPIVGSIGIGSITVSYGADAAVSGGSFQISFKRDVYWGPTTGITSDFLITNPNYGRFEGSHLEVERVGTINVTAGDITAGTGVITSLVSTNLNYDVSYGGTAYINSGIITDLNITNSVIGEVGITTSFVDLSNFDVGIGTILHVTDIYATNVYANVGVATALDTPLLQVGTANIAAGIITAAGIASAYINTAEINTGIITAAAIEEVTTPLAYINSGIFTDVNVTTQNTNELRFNTGFATNFTVSENINASRITATDVVSLGSSVGITSVVIDQAYINAGIFTDINVTDANFNNLKFNNGIGTYLGITTGFASGLGIHSLYANTGIFTAVQIQGSNIADSANFDRAVIGILTVTEDIFGVDQKNTGVSTFGTATINGVGQTTFHMTGDMRVSGEVKIGIGTTGITVDGDSGDIVGVSTFVANAGIMSAVTISGINTTTGLSRNVTLKTSNSGVSTDYTLVLPARLGKVGQVLSLQEDATIGFNTGGQGLYENRYYVSAVNGDDTNDGKTLPTKTIKRATQLASFDSFVIPGQRYLDAGDLMENNKDFIVDEVVGSVEFNYENIGIATIFPDYDQAIWKTYVGDTLDDLIYNIRFGGNNQVRARAVGFGTTAFSTTTEPALYAFEYLRYLTQYVVNNQTPPTYYTDPSVNTQSFDLTISQDPENNNANYFNRNKSARLLLTGNRQEIIDKSLASVAIGVTDVPSFYFPGDDGPITDRSRFYTAYRLIQKNRAEIVNYAWAATVATYPGISSTETKCKRDLGYFVDAISTDIFCGSNEYARRFMGFYFDANGNPTGNGLLGEETESAYAFTEAAVGMSSAVCNLLGVTDLTAPADPLTGNNNSASNCANVRSTITTLTGIVTTTVAAGSTSGISTTPNYGYFVVDYETNVRGNVGIATTMVTGGRKCARDLGYIIDAVTMDVSFGSNQHIQRATKFYFDGAGNPKTDGLVAEESISGYAFTSLAYYAKKAITNQLNFQDFTRPFDAGIGTNKGDLVCANTQASIDSLVGILTTAVLSGSLAGIPTSINFGIADCADVRQSLYNYVGIVTTAVSGIGSIPALDNPQTQSQPVCIFVEAGNYLEDNPIILYDDIAVVGDNLRNTIIRPLNQGKDLFKVRNGIYLTGFAMKDAIDVAGIPQSTWRFAVAFDDPSETSTSRIGYATKLDKPIISRSPYIQNCSILSFLGASGILVDGAKVQSPNTPIIKEEVETNADSVQPEQGKSMVAAAFTMVSFGGIGWRVINDGYSQVVSCFQIFCRYGSLAQSGGYLSITNSATNFGFYSLRATGFSRNSFIFDRGRIAATGTSGGLQTLKAVGYGRSDIDNYVLKFFNDSLEDKTNLFKPTTTQKNFDASTAVNLVAETLTITNHTFVNGDAVVYNGDEQDIPERIIGGLVNDNQYYVGYIDANTIQLYEDDSLQLLVDLTDTGNGGIHTLTKASQDFFATQITEAHNSYQLLTLAGAGSTANFQSGRLIQQTVASGTAIGYAVTYYDSSRELLVGLELSGGIRRPFTVSDGGSNLTVTDHTSPNPIAIGITVVAGLSTYWTVEFKVDSTTPGNQILNLADLPEEYRLHFHRPSIVNSSSHTWEYSGSGIDYNALPENGGKSDPDTEQVSELGGRVYSSGTNELGDFKVGDAITAFNRTGNIIFNNTVTIGTLDSIRLSLSGGAVIEEFSVDVGLGDNETGGAKNTRIATQLAIRSFLNNRLGSVLDKTVSTNAIPNAIVQLNAIGQINADLVPPRSVNYFRADRDGGRIQLVNLIPATNLNQGDTVVEPTDSFVLISDLIGQYLILDSSNDANDALSDFNFTNGFEVVSAVTGGGAIGLVTGPPGVGVNTTVVDPAIGYGTTGLVKGVPIAVTNLVGGSGYSNPGIYTGVRLDQSSGIGTGTSAKITIGPSGNVTNVAIQTGGFKYAVGNTLTLNDPSVIGGRVGGSNFTIDVAEVETRLYLALQESTAGTQKFPGSTVLPDYIADESAVGYSTNIGIALTETFTPSDYLVSGSVDFANDRIVLGSGHPFVDGDPVRYSTNGGVVINDLLDGEIYYAKTVGVTSVQLYTTYSLTTVKSLLSSGTGTHSLTRAGIVTDTNQIVFKNHPFNQGDAIRIAPGSPAPIGVTTGNFYYIGSKTTNSFTLHTTRNQSIGSVNGLLLNTIDLTAAYGENVGIVTFQQQNVVYERSVNTSSSDVSNFSLLSSSSLDAQNIISGTFDPARLGAGTANADVVLYGDSSFKKVIKSVGIGTTQPIGVTYTSADLAPNGVGVNTYFGDIQMTLNRVVSTPDDYSTLGISQFKLSTFGIGSDGEITIKSSTGGGDVDSATLGGQNGAYYLDINNSTGQLSIARGGTGLGALPGNGSMLIGNGSTYTLTGNPTLSGTMSAGFTVLGGKDITFTNSSSFTGDSSGRIQLYNNSLYLQYNTSLIFRESSGSTDVANINSSGDFTSIGDMQFRRGTFTQATGTAPFSVSSTTLINNLNADLLDGIEASSFVRADANDTVANNLSFTSVTTPITTNSIKFNNSEMTSAYYTESVGVLAFDENFYDDTAYGTEATAPAATFTTNGGGLVIKNEDGWGAVLSSQNIRWCEGNFANLEIGGNQVFHVGNDGPSSGLDADTVDGIEGASFLRSDAADTLDAVVTVGQNGRIDFSDISTIPDTPTNQQADYIRFGQNGSISQVSGRGGLMIASSDDGMVLANGDVGRGFTSSEFGIDAEDTFILSDFKVEVWTNLQNGFGSKQAFVFRTDGEFRAPVTVQANSDIKLKTNLRPLENCVDSISRIIGYRYERIDLNNREQVGVVAQEVEKEFPELVSEENGIKAVSYGNLVAVAFQAITELKAEIDTLREEIRELKGE
jgi:hypothetical protein